MQVVLPQSESPQTQTLTEQERTDLSYLLLTDSALHCMLYWWREEGGVGEGARERCKTKAATEGEKEGDPEVMKARTAVEYTHKDWHSLWCLT